MCAVYLHRLKTVPVTFAFDYHKCFSYTGQFGKNKEGEKGWFAHRESTAKYVRSILPEFECMVGMIEGKDRKAIEKMEAVAIVLSRF